MKNIPEKIYLQIGDIEDIHSTDDFNKLSGVSWCEDRINENDIEYVRPNVPRQIKKEMEIGDCNICKFNKTVCKICKFETMPTLTGGVMAKEVFDGIMLAKLEEWKGEIVTMNREETEWVYNKIKRSAMCEANSNAVLYDVAIVAIKFIYPEAGR